MSLEQKAKKVAKIKEEVVAKIRSQELAKIRVEEAAKIREEVFAREQEKARAKANSKSKAHSNSTSHDDDDDDKKKDKKEEEEKIQKKVDEAIAKRMAELPTCKGGDGSGRGNGLYDGILGGTNVFDKKINATDAVGKVGFTNYSLVKPPFKVKRCDQIILLPGKKLNPANYCEKEDAFMTMSIYMMNFFLKKDPNKLVESFQMYEITQIPSQLPGAPGCTMWMTKTKSFPFCYDSQETLDEVIEAYYAFLQCRRGPRGLLIAAALLKACDISKLDLSERGPFGPQGPVYRKFIESLDPNAFKKKTKKINLDGINPYYIIDNKVEIPGDFSIGTRMRMDQIKKMEKLEKQAQQRSMYDFQI